MRKLRARPPLAKSTYQKLRDETKLILKAPNPVKKASETWSNVRRRGWFSRDVISVLKQIAGGGEPCMYCDSNESAELEHYKPKSLFARLTFVWQNFLWICGVCNNYKGDRFPPVTEPGGKILNPLSAHDHPWNYMYLDEFGHLNEKWRVEIDDLDPRAKSTIEILKLNREALVTRRRSRMKELKQSVQDVIKLFNAKEISVAEINNRIKYLCTVNWAHHISAFMPDDDLVFKIK